MLWVPQKGLLRVQHNTNGVGSATPGTAVTTGGSAGTKGAAAEIFAATLFDAYWVTVIASNYGLSAAASQGCLDILTGAATEEVLIPNLLMGYCGGDLATNQNGPKRWDFPLYIPAGSRLAARAAGARVSTAMRVWLFLYGGDGAPKFRVGSKITTYGVGAVPNGTAITPGASGAEGAYVEVAAATAEDHFAFVPSFQLSADTTVNSRTYQVDVGAGAAPETALGEWWFHASGNELLSGPTNCMPAFRDVPASTRLAMRASNSGTNDGAYDGALHCVS